MQFVSIFVRAVYWFPEAPSAMREMSLRVQRKQASDPPARHGTVDSAIQCSVQGDDKTFDATIRVPPLPVGPKDIVFRVKGDGTHFGRLKVSKGTIVWLPGNKRKGLRLNWEQLDRLARAGGKRGSFPR